MPTEQLLADWTAHLRREEPQAVAILCHGSYARGTAEAHSDIDFDILLDGTPPVRYRSIIAEQPDGRLLHLTIAMMSLSDWIEQFVPVVDSEAWAFFLAARQSARLLWATQAAAEQLAGRITLELQLSPQLQDLLENAAKVRNAFARSDELGVRLSAHDMAVCCPALLALLQPVPRVETRRAALQAALELPSTPPGYQDDLLVCLGFSGKATTINDIHDAALRLADGIVKLLQTNPAALAGIGEPGLPEALADGRVARLLVQP